MSILTSDYIAGWYLLEKRSNNNLDTSQQPFYLVENISNTTESQIDARQLIQGDAGTLVIDQKGKQEKTTISGNALIINNTVSTSYVYKDIIDLLLYDYYLLLSFMFMSIEEVNNTGNLDFFNLILDALGLTLENRNLLTSANINIGQSITANLNYNSRHDDKFIIHYNNASEAVQPTYDFIARTAKNYDCRFYLDGNQYLIKSGSININIGYSENYIANTKSSLPFYSPQSHSVTGSFEVIAPQSSFQSVPTNANCSLLVGNRYIELGQAVQISNIKRELNPGTYSTISFNFTAYARLGAGIDFTRWTTYYLDKINNRRTSQNSMDILLTILKDILNI